MDAVPGAGPNEPPGSIRARAWPARSSGRSAPSGGASEARGAPFAQWSRDRAQE